MQFLAAFPALTIMIFTRRKLGFRFLKPSRLIIMAAILGAINSLTNDLPFVHPAGSVFAAFPLVMLIFGLQQRHQRWQELARGESWHTMSPGISYLEFLPLPAFLKSHRRLYRFCEPSLCFIFSMIFGMFVSTALARWFAFSSLCMFIFEQNLFERALENDLDVLDGLIASEVQAGTVEHFKGQSSDEEQRAIEDTAGIPTGVAFDIQKQIELRRAKLGAAVAE